jgi:CRISPR-associated protein Csb2
VGSIRTAKVVQPRIPQPGALLYAWRVEDDAGRAAALIADAANEIYQLGRGVDMAWATGEIVDDEALAERLRAYDGEVRTPHPSSRRFVLACPAPGSLESLVRRHRATRLRTEGTGRRARTFFTNAPKPFFVGAGYAPEVTRLLFDLRRVSDPDRAFVSRHSEVVSLVERLRDGAAERLRVALPESVGATIERNLIGKRPDDPTGGFIAQRIRIVPLPSIEPPWGGRRLRWRRTRLRRGSSLRGGPGDLVRALTSVLFSSPPRRLTFALFSYMVLPS